jgi:hypothetical protein
MLEEALQPDAHESLPTDGAAPSDKPPWGDHPMDVARKPPRLDRQTVRVNEAGPLGRKKEKVSG